MPATRVAPTFRRASIGALAAALMLPAAALARQQPASAATSDTGQVATAAPPRPQTPAPPDTFRAVWNDRPSLRLWGDAVRLDVRLHVQADVVNTDLQPADENGLADFRRGRIGLNGAVGTRVTFQVERDVANAKGWRDVFVNVRLANAAQFEVGQFKQPFSMEALKASTSLDFVRRSLAASALAPGRDVGVMFHGRPAGQWTGPRLEYELGVFRHDGDNAALGPLATVSPGGGYLGSSPTVAGRLQVSPFDRSKRTDKTPAGGGGTAAGTRASEGTDTPGAGKSKTHKRDKAKTDKQGAGADPVSAPPPRPRSTLGSLKLGIAATTSRVAEGDNGLRGQDVFSKPFFPRIDVKGRRMRIGTEASWKVGPATIRGELMQSRDERRGQGVAGEDLSPLVATGWYVQGTWNLVRGGKKASPAGRWVGRGGVGDIELAARGERLGFRSASGGTDPESASPRAENLAPVSDTVVTLGVNWRPVPMTKLQLNAVHERIEGFPWTNRDRQDAVWRLVASFHFAF